MENLHHYGHFSTPAGILKFIWRFFENSKMSRNGHFRVLVFWWYHTPSAKPLFCRDHLKGNANSALVALICAYFETCVSHWFLKGPAKVAVLLPGSLNVWEIVLKECSKIDCFKGKPLWEFCAVMNFLRKNFGFGKFAPLWAFFHTSRSAPKSIRLGSFRFWANLTNLKKSWFEVFKINSKNFEFK